MTGTRPPTIADVARAAGVSTATVSRALSGAPGLRPETRERVLAIARQLGYRPSGVARALKRGMTRTLGLIVTDIANPYFPAVVRAVEDAARQHGFTVLLGNGDEDPDREAAYLELLAERRVDGLIVASGALGERHRRWLVDAPVPVVLVNSALPDTPLPAILSDNRAGGRLAAEHLLQLGHRRLGHIAGPPSSSATAERLAGIREAMAAWGLDPADLALETGDGHPSGGAAAMERLLRRQPAPTGVLCYNDLTAIGALRAAHARGLRVPEDLSIVGFDDIEAARYVEPPLTTVAQQVAAMGRWAVDYLVGQFSRPGGPGHLAGQGHAEEPGHPVGAGQSRGPGHPAGEGPSAPPGHPAGGGQSEGPIGGSVVLLPVTLSLRGSTGPPPGAG
jgi:LacI family transcriptional regulator